jgi:hypothetical protein
MSSLLKELVCMKKKAYYSNDDARRQIKRYKGNYMTELFPYKCPTCKAWHLTKRKPKGVSNER